MFTGIVQHVGRVAEVAEREGGGKRITLDPQGWRHEAAAGDSICISGCCLTVAEQPAGPDAPLAFDAVPETLRLTTLGTLEPGSRVNLEASVTPVTLLGGHLVQGHVEGVGTVRAIQKGTGEGAGATGDWRVRIALPGGKAGAEMAQCITPKGSVTVAGVSLTVAAIPAAAEFEVALIPTTLERTTLGELAEGDGVNLETDIIARTVVHWLRTYGGGSTFGAGDARRDALGRWGARGGGGGGGGS